MFIYILLVAEAKHFKIIIESSFSLAPFWTLNIYHYFRSYYSGQSHHHLSTGSLLLTNWLPASTTMPLYLNLSRSTIVILLKSRLHLFFRSKLSNDPYPTLCKNRDDYRSPLHLFFYPIAPSRVTAATRHCPGLFYYHEAHCCIGTCSFANFSAWFSLFPKSAGFIASCQSSTHLNITFLVTSLSTLFKIATYTLTLLFFYCFIFSRALIYNKPFLIH